MGVKQNEMSIRALKLKPVRYETSVDGLRGLWVRVWPSGERTFLLRYQLDGVTRRVSLGTGSLAEARKEWARRREELKRGKDIAEDNRRDRGLRQRARVAARREPTVAELAKRYIDEHARPHKRSWLADQQRLDRHVVPRWGTMLVKEIRRADVKDLLTAIVRRGKPTEANRTLALIRKLFAFAVNDAGLLDANPCSGMAMPSSENGRERTLSDHELRALWQEVTAHDGPMSPLVAAVLRMQLLTGCRVGEVAGARWDEFDSELQTWRIPGARTKNGEPHEVPLSAATTALLDALPRTSDHVFPWPGATGHVRLDTITKSLAAVLKARKDLPYRTHDLRRTVATRLAGSIRLSRVVLDKVLNHVDRSVTGAHYDVHDYLVEKREALGSWANLLKSIVEPGLLVDNVVSLSVASRQH